MRTASVIVCLIGIALASPIRKARDASSESMEGGNSDSDEMNPLVGQQYFLYPHRPQPLIPPPPKYYRGFFPVLPPKYSPYLRKPHSPFHSQYFMRYPNYAQQPFYSDYNKHLKPMVYDSYPHNYHVFPLIKRIHNLAANRLGHHSTGSSFESSRESSPEVKSNSMEHTRTEEHMEDNIPSVPSLDGIFMHNKPNDALRVSEHNAGLDHFTGNYLSSEEVTDEEDPYDVLVNSDFKGVEYFRSFRADMSSEQVNHDTTSSESADETLNHQELESQRVSRVGYEDDKNANNKGQDIEIESLQMTDSNSRGDSSEDNTFESTEDGDENRAEQKIDLRAETIEDSTAENSEDEDSKTDLRNRVIDDDKTDSNDNYDNEYEKADLGSESTEDNSDESTEDDDDKDNSKANLMVDSNEGNSAESIEDNDEDSKADLRVHFIEDNTSESNDDSDDEDSEADLRVHFIEDDTSESSDNSDDEDKTADLRVHSIEDNTSESSDDEDNKAYLSVESIEDDTSESTDVEDSTADLKVQSIEDNTSESSDDEADLRVESIEDNTSESSDDEDSTADLRVQSIEDNTSEPNDDSDEDDNEADLRVHSIKDNSSESSDDSDEDSEADLRVQSIEDNTSESNDDSEDEDSRADRRVQSIEDNTSESSDDNDDEDSEADLRVQSIEDNTSESNDDSEDEDSRADRRVQSIEDNTSESSDDSDDEDSEADLRVQSIEDNTSESSDDDDSTADLKVQSIEDNTSESSDDSHEDNEGDLRVESIEDNISESNDDSEDEDSTADQRARLIEDKASESTDDNEAGTAEDNISETTDESDNRAELNADSSATKSDESNEGDSNESNFVFRSLQENPCNNHPCKRGKVCELDVEGMPMCVCQDTSTCPTRTIGSQHVCGTNNQTYESSCQFFASKCILEGTRKGRRLHLDYFGPCRAVMCDIPPCQDNELYQFPFRLRNWLKNVLEQKYERHLQTPGAFPEKQRNRVKNIYESEKNLHAGDHSLDLPHSDFKNYHPFIYPVHWQFRQLDQQPTDGYLSHSELAPLCAPLIPIEHCASRIFIHCNTDGDRFLSLREWAHCFDISEEDINPDLTF